MVGKPCRWYHAKRPEREEMLVADLSREQDVLDHGIRSELVLSPLRRSVLVLVLVLERNVWFWCVHGRVARASRRHKESRGPCPSASRLAHDRLTHPTGLLLLLLLLLLLAKTTCRSLAVAWLRSSSSWQPGSRCGASRPVLPWQPSHPSARHLPPGTDGRLQSIHPQPMVLLPRTDPIDPHPTAQRFGHHDATIGLLVVFENRDQRPADGDRGAIERMDEVRPFLPFDSVADI